MRQNSDTGLILSKRSRARLEVKGAPDMLAAWSDDADVVAARAAVDSGISAVELTQRITKARAR